MSNFMSGAAYFVGRIVGQFTQEEWVRMLRAVGETYLDHGAPYSIEEVLVRFNQRLKEGWNLVPPGNVAPGAREEG